MKHNHNFLWKPQLSLKPVSVKSKLFSFPLSPFRSLFLHRTLQSSLFSQNQNLSSSFEKLKQTMARTKGKAKKATVHSSLSSSSSPSLPPDLNRTPPTSPPMSEPHSPELSLSPPLSHIRTSHPPSSTKSRDSCEEVMNVQPLEMICQEEVSTKEIPVQNKKEEVADEQEKEASNEEGKEASVEKKRKASSMEKGSDIDAQVKEKTPAKPKPKAKKAKSFGTRRSQTIIAGIGIRKTQSVDNTVHEITDSDEEQNPKHQSEDVPEKIPTPSEKNP